MGWGVGYAFSTLTRTTRPHVHRGQTWDPPLSIDMSKPDDVPDYLKSQPEDEYDDEGEAVNIGDQTMEEVTL